MAVQFEWYDRLWLIVNTILGLLALTRTAAEPKEPPTIPPTDEGL